MTKVYYLFTALSLLVLNFVSYAVLFGLFDVQKIYAVDYEPSPRAYLAKICKEPDCDFYLLDAIAWCESKWKMVDNPISTAHGYFQILDGTEATTPMHHEGGSKFDPYDNVDMGIFLYKRDGINPWLTSRGCWQWKYQGAMLKKDNQCLGPLCE